MAKASLSNGWRFLPLSLPLVPRRLSRDSSAVEVYMVNVNVVLTDELKQFVDQEVCEGDCASASEYVRDLIRQRRRSKAEDLLRQLIAEGLASGPPAPCLWGTSRNCSSAHRIEDEASTYGPP